VNLLDIAGSNLRAIHSQQVKDLISFAKVRIIYETTKERAKKKKNLPTISGFSSF